MNNINTSHVVDPNLEQPFKATSLFFLQNAIAEMVNGIAQGVSGEPVTGTEAYVLWGCQVTTVGGNYSYASGYIYNAATSEVFIFNGGTIPVSGFTAAILSLTVTNDATADPTVFSDNSTTFNVHNIRRLTIANGTLGSGLINYQDLIFNNAKWNVVGASGQPAFTNSWGNDSASTLNSMSFRKKSTLVNLKGAVVGGSSANGIFTLPSGYRPLKITILPVVNYDNTAATYPPYIEITTGGVVTPYFAAGTRFSLDGLSFYLD